jgi:predicted flap endonuclease-1-like 5' DNA nuclease
MILVPASEDEIRKLAYQYWEEEGHPEGRHEMHWQRAWLALSQPADTQAKKAAKAKTAKPTATEAVVSDITLIDGIGPKFKKLLGAEGIASLADLAALSAAALSKIDEKLGFKGRSARDGWIAQAKDLIAGGTPRAKSDRARA